MPLEVMPLEVMPVEVLFELDRGGGYSQLHAIFTKARSACAPTDGLGSERTADFGRVVRRQPLFALLGSARDLRLLETE